MACVVVDEGDHEHGRVVVVFLLHVLLCRAFVLIAIATPVV
jgi:hypothetical protein